MPERAASRTEEVRRSSAARICMYIYIYIYMDIHTTYTYTQIYIYIYIYLFIYIYIRSRYRGGITATRAGTAVERRTGCAAYSMDGLR